MHLMAISKYNSYASGLFLLVEVAGNSDARSSSSMDASIHSTVPYARDAIYVDMPMGTNMRRDDAKNCDSVRNWYACCGGCDAGDECCWARVDGAGKIHRLQLIV